MRGGFLIFRILLAIYIGIISPAAEVHCTTVIILYTLQCRCCGTRVRPGIDYFLALALFSSTVFIALCKFSHTNGTNDTQPFPARAICAYERRQTLRAHTMRHPYNIIMIIPDNNNYCREPMNRISGVYR